MHACLALPVLSFYPVPVPNFGSWLHRRRLELGLSLSRAASLAGIAKSTWESMEQGWFPVADANFWRSLAATLEVDYADMEHLIAAVAEHFEGTREQ